MIFRIYRSNFIFLFMLAKVHFQIISFNKLFWQMVNEQYFRFVLLIASNIWQRIFQYLADNKDIRNDSTYCQSNSKITLKINVIAWRTLPNLHSTAVYQGLIKSWTTSCWQLGKKELFEILLRGNYWKCGGLFSSASFSSLPTSISPLSHSFSLQQFP